MALHRKDGRLKYRWPLIAVAVALLLAVSWQVWDSQRLIGELRAELTSASADRADLAARLEAQEQRIQELEAGLDRPARQWSAEGLADQPRMAELKAMTEVLPDIGWTPGTTSWRQSDLTIPEAFTRAGSTYQSPGALVAELVPALNLAERLGQETWELTVRVYLPEDGQASAIIMGWGFRDDSVAGMDHLLGLRQHQAVWYVVDVQERFHCWRGVSDDLCL
jgi:hypothetical protein